MREPGDIAITYPSTSGTADVLGHKFRDEDIGAYDFSAGAQDPWSLLFDGSAEGLGERSQDVNAFHVEVDGGILLSVKVATTLPAVVSDGRISLQLIDDVRAAELASSQVIYLH